MKILSLTTLLSWILFHSSAQTSHAVINLKGNIVDSTSGKPLGYATLLLQNAKTKAPAKNFIANDDGSFEMSFVDSMEYQLVLAFTGFDNKAISISRGHSA
ncbi:MAG TPA: carboxypeptidase-like regulatory domain-containing protein, partial [Puia sp.]